ncbi:MAG: Ser-Thr-rich GPI-anchored membrane family protein [Candidatus Aminicenantes bacterium]|jgi:hypothetical protein
MKKTLLFLFIFISISGLLTSQNIVVTNPNAAAKWIQGRNYVITWDKAGEMSTQVKIILYQSENEVLVIADSTDNDGAHSWTVPPNLLPGKYAVHVMTLDESVSDRSDDFFVENAPAIKSVKPTVTGTAKKIPPQIKMVCPNGGENWTVGTEEEITWEYSGLSGNVNIMLHKKNEEGRVVQKVNIARGVPINSRSYIWKVGKHASGTIRPFEMFSVEVQTADRKYKDESDQTFSVVYPSGKAISKPTSGKKDQEQTGGASAGGATDKKTQEGATAGKTGQISKSAAQSASTKGEKKDETAPVYVSPLPDLRCRISGVKLKTGPLPFPPGAVARKAEIRFLLRYDTSGTEEKAPGFKIRVMLVDQKINRVIKSKEGTIVTLPSNKWDSRFSQTFDELMKGPFTFIVLLDPENQIRESNEDNNRREKQFKFDK